MGTRNITAVFHEGKYKLAQYGQWDGSPEVQGVTCLEFVKKIVCNCCLENFVKNLDKIRLLKESDPNPTQEESDWSKEYWTRDNGAKILQKIFDCQEPEKIIVKDEIKFCGDSFMCEWSYVIDLDRKFLEVYKGFNKKPLSSQDRFFPFKNEKFEPYQPVRKIIEFSFSDLPSGNDFIELCSKANDN